MTKKELVEKLKDYDDNSIVVIAGDSEGNSYGELWDISPYLTIAKPHEGEFYTEDATCGEYDLDEDEWAKLKKKARKVLVFYP